ncbi:hypothetical protein FHU35_17217 [Saccharopolyspora dendranthemae]|uniref:Uncharacterized protein n=1 Tax=Saccharopolyspora dendranthemae TaxID=1181886 RepID=A0A561TZP9_9PSEU|nr:hypothetical protein FHU35_17217 [Saccharopolyspora dendranthemae]
MTGEPRPPRGPLSRDWRKPEENSRRALSKVPHPPEGAGRILESFHPTIASSYTFGFGISLAVLGLLTLQDLGFWWMHVWWLWLFVVPWPFLFVLKRSRIRISAGADWLMYGKSGLIKTYELTKVNLDGSGWNAVLEIEDRAGERIRAPLRRFQYNRELWDLVYLGLLHSVQAGPARSNAAADAQLGLKVPAHHREWEFPEC